jgi:uncharacterized membrane protein
MIILGIVIGLVIGICIGNALKEQENTNTHNSTPMVKNSVEVLNKVVEKQVEQPKIENTPIPRFEGKLSEKSQAILDYLKASGQDKVEVEEIAMVLDYTKCVVSAHITDLQKKGLVVRMTKGEKRYVCLTE